MTSTAIPLCSGQQPNGSVGGPAETMVRLVAPGTGPLPSGPCRAPGTVPPAAAEPDRARAAHDRAVRSWPLLVLALPAAVAVWSGWVGIGQMTGFGVVRPLPGIWGSLHLNTAVTLPVGVEAYAAYALRAWLSTGNKCPPRPAGSPVGRRSARCCWAWPARSPTTCSPNPGPPTRRGASPPQSPAYRSWSWAWAPRLPTSCVQTQTTPSTPA
jgi:hypothetical protein